MKKPVILLIFSLIFLSCFLKEMETLSNLKEEIKAIVQLTKHTGVRVIYKT
jgi:hypothetical protein